MHYLQYIIYLIHCLLYKFSYLINYISYHIRISWAWVRAGTTLKERFKKICPGHFHQRLASTGDIVDPAHRQTWLPIPLSTKTKREITQCPAVETSSQLHGVNARKWFWSPDTLAAVIHAQSSPKDHVHNTCLFFSVRSPQNLS